METAHHVGLLRSCDNIQAQDSSQLYNAVSVVTMPYSQAHLPLHVWAKEHAELNCLCKKIKH